MTENHNRLIRLINEIVDCYCHPSIIDLLDVKRFVDHLQSNGVVIPVRCEECKHSREYRCKVDPMRNHRLCYKYDRTVRVVEDDFYCAYGERKGNE